MKHNLLISSGFLCLCCSVFAGGTVYNLTQADLEAALAGGGAVLFGTNGTLTLTNTILIAKDTTLDGNGNDVMVSGGNSIRLFQVASNVTFALKGLSLADGRVVAHTGNAFGASIWNQGGQVVLTDCTLTNNLVQGTNDGGNSFGAAICTIGGSFTITNCSITGSQAIGGGVPSTNTAPSGVAMGGAIYSQGTRLTLERVVVSDNAVTGGARLPSIFNSGLSGNGFGGALYVTNSALTMSSCLVQSNIAYGGAPTDLTRGGTSGDADGGGLFVCNDSTCSISDCSFLDNSARGGAAGRNHGGGSGRGGDIFSSGHMQIQASTFSNSQTSAGKGYSLSPGLAQGGEICSTAFLSVNGCAFVNGSATGGDSGIAPSPGGAAEGGAVWSSGLLACTNSTIAGCRVLGGQGAMGSTPGGVGTGGGLYLINVTAVLVNLTLGFNRADGTNVQYYGGPALGGNLAVNNATVSVFNSIIADSGNGGDVWGSVTDGGYNICSDGTANFSAPSSLNQADPLLAALSDNGGPTPTMALLVGSPARDAIVSNFPPTDQRGVARPQGPAADIGAYEADFLGGTAPTIVTQPMPQTVRAGTNIIFSVGVSGTRPLYYQWRKDGNPMEGAASSALNLSNVQSTNAGAYSVVVTNAFGNTTSSGAMLIVDSTPVILVQPVSVVVSAGAATNFTVIADGPSLTYQWWHESAPVSGGTAATLNILSALAGAQGNYFVVVSNFAKDVTSSVATLSFDSSALSIQVAPKDAIAETGYPASFSVVAAGIPPFAYQWQFNGQPIPGATSSSYAISAVTTNLAGTYSVVVTNGYRMVSSPTAQLTVTDGAIPPNVVPARFGQSLSLTFSAQAGRTYRLLSSGNFTKWSSIATNAALSAGPVQFVEPIATGQTIYYRVVTP